MNFSNPATPSARWSPAIRARRPMLGGPSDGGTLAVRVTRDGLPLEGVEVEALFANGESGAGITDEAGMWTRGYGVGQKGQTVVRITPPSGVEGPGEAAVQGLDLQGGPAAVEFNLVGAGSPLVGIGVAGLLYGLALAAF